MNIKYSFIFSAFLCLLLNTLIHANEKSLEFNEKELKKIIEIEKKHNIDWKKEWELKKTVYGCLINNPTAESKELGYKNAFKLLNYYNDLLINVGLTDQEIENLIGTVDLLSWCIKDRPEKQMEYINLVRSMVDLNILVSDYIYGEKEGTFSGGLMNYSIFSEDLNLDKEDRWQYDEKIIKTLILNLPKSFKDLQSFIYFSSKDFEKDFIRPKIINILKPEIKALNYESFKSEELKKDFLTFSGNYLRLLAFNKDFKGCNSYYDKKIKDIKFEYEKIELELNMIDYKLNCLMSDLQWDNAIELYKYKANKIEKAFKNHEYSQYEEENLNRILFKTYNALVGAYRFISTTDQDDQIGEEYLDKAKYLVDNFFFKRNKYYYLLLSKDLIDDDIYKNNINKAEKKITKLLEEIENLTEEDGYPFKSGFEIQKEDLRADYFGALSQILVKTKRYKEAIAVNEKIINSTQNILTGDGKELNISNQFNMESFKYKAANIDLFIIYNLLQDRKNQNKYHNIVSNFCDEKLYESVCLNYYPEKLKYAVQIRDLDLINYSYEQLKNYYSNFKSENEHINYMTETELIKQKIEINMLKIQYSDEFKLNQKQVSELRKEACNDTDKFEKRLRKTNKQIGRFIKNPLTKDVFSYQSVGIHFINVGLECKKTKTDYKKAINLLQKVLDLEKKKLDKWVNIPTYYQYDIDTNLISQIGFAAAGYKSLSGNEKRLPEADKLLNDVFRLSQYGKNLFITNAIKNSITKTIDSNDDFKNLVVTKASLQTELNILMNEILNNKSFEKDKFKQKNLLDLEIQSINEKIDKEFPDIKKKLNKKFYKVQDVQSKLKEDELMLVFDSHITPFAHIISKDNHDTFYSVLPIRDLYNFTFLFRKKLFKSDVIELKKSLNIFYNTLFQEIEKKNKSKKKIIIVTDKYTENLPFGIFYSEKNDSYLIEKYSLSYHPSVGSFVELRNEKSIKNISFDNTFLGIGNPLLQEKTLKDLIVSISDLNLNSRGILEDTSIIKEKFKNLPYSEYELKKLSKIFRKNKLLLSEQANEAYIKNANLKNFDIISFATHAGISGSLNESSEPFLVLTPPKKSNNINDGILTASEVSQLDLNAKLVILSACNTAARQNEYASGFSGLVASFFNAGAQNILATHWNVDDKTTATMIIETIKKSVKQNLSLAEALKLTKIDFILGKYGEKYKHPKYWGAYVIVGN